MPNPNVALNPYIPVYTPDPESERTRAVITAEDWNALWYTIITQGNYQTDSLRAVCNELASLLSNITLHKGSNDHDARYYTETEIDGFLSSIKGAGYTDESLTQLKGLITGIQTQLNTLNSIYSTDAERIAAINQVINDFKIADDQLATLLATKANSADVYTKAQVDAKTWGSTSIQDGAIGTTKLANSAVRTSNVDTNAITYDKLGIDVQATLQQIGAGAFSLTKTGFIYTFQSPDTQFTVDSLLFNPNTDVLELYYGDVLLVTPDHYIRAQGSRTVFFTFTIKNGEQVHGVVTKSAIPVVNGADGTTIMANSIGNAQMQNDMKRGIAGGLAVFDDREYQTVEALSAGAMRLARQSSTKRLFINVIVDLAYPTLGISLNNKTPVPLKDIDGNQVTSISKGLWEVVDNTGFFTLRPRGGDDVGFFGKYTSSELTLLPKVSQGSYIYSNEDVQLVLDSAIDQTINRSTPVNVVGSALITSASARPQRLSNGWIVTAVNDTTDANNRYVKLFVSKDNGATATQLCYYQYTNSGGTINGFSIASYNNTVHLLVTTGLYVYYIKIDATTVTNTDQSANKVLIDPNQVNTKECYITVDTTGVIHAVWSSKNNTYPNSFNLRYSKSTDGTTWNTPTQITNLNTTGSNNVTEPVLVIQKTTNYPVILCHFEDSYPSRRITCYRYNGTGWLGADVYSVLSAYIQSYPSVTVTSDGVIHVVWTGLDSTDSTANNIRYSKSSDGGATWSAPIKLTSGNTYIQTVPCISSNSSDQLFVTINGQTATSVSKYNIRQIVWNGTAWGSITEITNQSVAQMSYQSTCDNYKNFTEPLMVYQDNQAVAVKFRGVFVTNSNIQLIPNINNATAESQLVALGAGVLKSLGTALKRYSGIISKKSKGWS